MMTMKVAMLLLASRGSLSAAEIPVTILVVKDGVAGLKRGDNPRRDPPRPVAF
jgi:hypothetical protein